MGSVLKDIIKRFENIEKRANETLAANPGALVGVDNMPGSEHDANVPAEAKKPDAEVLQGLPANAQSTEGAVNGGDAKPLNEGKLEVNQPLENPTQKPLISDNALTAKEASARLEKTVNELLDCMKTTKQAQCGGGEASTAKTDKPNTSKSENKSENKSESNEGKEKTAGTSPKLELDEETLSKIATATASFMEGRKAAESAIKQAAEKQASYKANAIAIIKAACIKSAQESGLSPEEAAAAADNAMAAAGVPAGEVAAAGEAAAADAGAAAAGEAAAADAGAAAGVQIPEDVTEEELGSAIIDLVREGKLDVDTAKAIVDDIAGDSGAGGDVTEDQAAEIIADGLESGEITPEQAKDLAAAIQAGGEADAGAAAAEGAASAEDAAAAKGAADAAAAIQDAQDEARGAAIAEAAMKQAAAAIRNDALNKIASAIVEKREQAKKAAAQPKSGLIDKVASILKKRKEAYDAAAKAEAEKQAAAAKEPTEEERYIAGFCKKASEMGVDPEKLAQYICANKDRFAKAEK